MPRPRKLVFLARVSLLTFAIFAGAGCGTSSKMSTSSGTGPGGGSGPAPASCPSVTLAEAGPQAFPSAPPLPPPNPGSGAAGSVCVSSPANGASVTSPMTMSAEANLAQASIEYMRVYIDGSADYFTFYNKFTALFWMPNGTHNLEVIATDTNGNSVSTTLSLNVTSQAAPPVVSSIQNIPNWEPCSALYAPGTPRAGQICASGDGTAVSTMTEDVSQPSLSGSSAHFTLGGPTAYSNELYTMNLGGGDSPTQFVYDFYVMVDNPKAPQALEFDVNQTIDDTRWTFGTECNFNGNWPNVGEWDVWNGAPDTGWEKTSAPCPQFPANQWQHIVWTFERVGDQVHYVSLQVNDTTYPLNLYFADQQDWSMGQINVAFQMDGNVNQTPYNAWLDNVNLTVQ
jgi:hypothetical protein